MDFGIRADLSDCYNRMRDDIRTDRFLRYILLVAVFTSGFWFWWRIPSFTVPDEFSRLLYPMMTARYFLTEPVRVALQRAAETGPGVGKDATFYLHAVLLSPIFLYILLTGKLGLFTSIGGERITRFAYWNAAPEWFWESVLIVARLANVIFAVGIVYLIYRIGSTIADRQAGRIASLSATLSLAVFQSAHEVNEDTVMVLLLLTVLLLSIKYIHGAEDRYFLIGCGLGGTAIAFKLTAGVGVLFLAAAYVMRQFDPSDPFGSLWRPRLLGSGFALGSVALYVFLPSLLVSGPEWLLDRVFATTVERKSVTTDTQEYRLWISYLNGLGLPLALATVYSVSDHLRRLYRDWRSVGGELLLLIGVSGYLLVFTTVFAPKTHHLLPVIPLLLLLLGITLSRRIENGSQIVTFGLVVLLATTTVYAAGGLSQFPTDPRDQATAWMQSEVEPEAEVLVIKDNPEDYGIEHGRSVILYPPNGDQTRVEWLQNISERRPDLIMLSGRDLAAADHGSPESEFYTQLLNGAYGYSVSAEFGDRSLERYSDQSLLYAGITPRIEKRSAYIVILERDDSVG